MNKRTFSISIAVAVTLVAVAVFGYTLVHAVIYAPDTGGPEVPAQISPAGSSTIPISAASSSSAAPVQAGLPSRLQIPALSIDAHVQQVGVNGAGNMSAPSNFTDVAWYKYGTKPGQEGSAVMAGHVDNGLALSGVFKHLSDIKAGDDIYVVTDTGANLHFVVSSVDSYEYKDVPTTQVFMENDKAYLKLLTCTGDWVPGDRTYDRRLVVTAVLQ